MSRISLTGSRWVLVALCILICPFLALSLAPAPTNNAVVQVILTGPTPKDLDTNPYIPCSSHYAQVHRKGHLNFQFSSPDRAWRDERLLEHLKDPKCNHILDSTHTLTISGYGSLANWTSVTTVLPLFPHLEKLHWSNTDPIPVSILTAMAETHPEYRLYYQLPLYAWDAYSAPYDNATEERGSRRQTVRRILHDRNLYSLKASIEYAGGDAESMPLIHEIITTCPNLRRLGLSLGYYGGCEPGSPHIYAFDFTDKKFADAKIPPLEVLKLNGYDFDLPLKGTYERHSWSSGESRYKVDSPWNWILPRWLINAVDLCHQPEAEWMCTYVRPPWRPIPCPSNFSCTSNLDGWLDRMNFSHLHTLEIQSPSSATLHKLTPVLTNLSSLTIHHGDMCTAGAIQTFLSQTASPLSHLKLRNIRFPSLDPLMQTLSIHHNTSLTSFSLHEHEELREHSCYYGGPEGIGDIHCRDNEDARWWNPHLYLNNSQLQTLVVSLPNMTGLEIDIDRNQTQDAMDEIFSTLSRFQHLSKLTVHVESPSIEGRRNGSRNQWGPPKGFYDQWGRLADPTVNQSWVFQTFDKIRWEQREANPCDDLDTVPALQQLEVFVGRWETKDESSMMGPTRSVIGKFVCKIAVPSYSGRKVECSGGVQLPGYYGGGGYGTMDVDGFDVLESGDWSMEE